MIILVTRRSREREDTRRALHMKVCVCVCLKMHSTHTLPLPSDPSKSYGTMKVMFIMDNDPTPYRINVALR
jgi:hypothetical protein